MRRLARALAVAAALVAVAPATADAALVVKPVAFTASDGAKLHAFVGGDGEIRARPTLVEFTPYGESCCPGWVGPDYNYVVVHARGTGLSTGTWNAVGPRDQRDVSEFLAWACRQPWSNGTLGLYGFSASAIAVYNSLHLPLPCVKAASLMAGTHDLYRDLLYPGGIMNLVPGAVVGFGVGIPLLLNSTAKPVEGLQSGVGFLGTITEILAHNTRDAFWEGHSQRPGPNTFPVLANTGFYDPEARGPFESFKDLRAHGAHLMVMGAHDGFPAGAGTPFGEYKRWFDHHLLGKDNGIDRDPKVKLWLGHGSREALLGGKFTRVDADAWPVPGTRWQRLFLGADSRLRDDKPAAQATQSHPSIVSLGTASDPHTTSVAGAAPALLGLTEMKLAEPLSLSWTTPPLTKTLDVAGPASLDVFVSSTSPESDLHAVVADVWPDGRAFPVGVGRLRTSFPKIDRARSVIVDGEVVQPYNDYSAKQPAAPGQRREYHIEFWPLGNRFAAGHRIRLYLVGTSSFMLPALPGIHTVSMGGATPSRLLLPVLPDAAARKAAARRKAAAARRKAAAARRKAAAHRKAAARRKVRR